jgi:hypothetical protein
MSLSSFDSPSTRDETPDPAERRQRLAVLCALDRAQLRLALAPPPRPPEPAQSVAGEGLKSVLNATRFLPGKLGVWSRRVGFAASMIRLLR